MRKLLVLGLDGFSYSWAFKFNLSSFLSLLENSQYGILKSTFLPSSPPSWTSMLTGVPPFEHGIFNFYDIFSRKLITLHDSKSPLLWEIMDAYRIPSSWLWIPMTYPAPKLKTHSLFFAGFPYPSFSFKSLEKFVSPIEKAKILVKTCSDFIKLFYHKNVSVKSLLDNLEIRYELLRNTIGILDKYKLIWAVLPESDHVWHYYNKIHIGRIVYQKLDDLLDAIISDALREGYDVLVISDHGTSDMIEKGFFVNNFLRDLGLILDYEKDYSVFEEKFYRFLYNFGGYITETIPFRLSLSIFLKQRKSPIDVDMKALAYGCHGPTSRYGYIKVFKSSVKSFIKKKLLEEYQPILKRVVDVGHITKMSKYKNDIFFETREGVGVFESFTQSKPFLKVPRYFVHSKNGILMFIEHERKTIRRYLGKLTTLDVFPSVLSYFNMKPPRKVGGSSFLNLPKGRNSINKIYLRLLSKRLVKSKDNKN